MLLLCSAYGLQAALTSAVYLMVLVSTHSTEECELQLTGNMKNRSFVFSKVDMKLCQTKCIEESFIFAFCRPADDKPVTTEKTGSVPSESCGAKVCNETCQCLDEGCEKVCVEAPSLCELHSASRIGDLSRVKFVLSQGRTDINCQEWIGRTPVMWAAGGGHTEIMELLLSKGANLLLVDRFGFNILHSASLGGEVEVVKNVLSNHNVGINRAVRCGRTAVMLAAENGHKDVVELLVKHRANLALRDKVGDNILHLACLNGYLDVVKYIISLHTVNINSGGFKDKTPVMLAGQGGHKVVVEFLVNHGAYLALRNSDHDNILHLTSYGGYVDVVKYVFAQNKVNINRRGSKNRPPVIIAGMQGHKELVELFVKHGAKLSLKDRFGKNILHYASAGGHLDVVKYIISLHKVGIDSGGQYKRTPLMEAGNHGRREVVEFLINQGAELSLIDSDTNNILHLTSYGGSVDVMKYVLSFNMVDVNGRGWKKRTPVMIAGKKGYKELVELFYKHGADLSLADREGNNIIHLAIGKRRMEVLKYVLSLGTVNINAKNKRGQSAVTRARSQGKQDVVDFLVSQGAHI